METWFHILMVIINAVCLVIGSVFIGIFNQYFSDVDVFYWIGVVFFILFGLGMLNWILLGLVLEFDAHNEALMRVIILDILLVVMIVAATLISQGDPFSGLYRRGMACFILFASGVLAWSGVYLVLFNAANANIECKCC